VNQYKQGAFFSYNFVGENSWNGYERKCLFANVGNGQFMDVARPTGSDGIKDGRGVAIADFNSDGKLDLVLNNNNSQPTVYLNRVRKSGNSVEIKLKGSEMDLDGKRSSRDAIGAQVRLAIAGKTMLRQVEAGSGFASEVMQPIHFGLGSATRIEALEIRWPSGRVQKFDGPQASSWINSQIQITEGASQASEVVPDQTPARALVSGRKVNAPPM
jgi:hypothetical protein